jgi:hypothetical protein
MHDEVLAKGSCEVVASNRPDILELDSPQEALAANALKTLGAMAIALQRST